MNKWLIVGLLSLNCWAQNSGFLTFTNPSNPTVKATELLDNQSYSGNCTCN